MYYKGRIYLIHFVFYYSKNYHSIFLIAWEKAFPYHHFSFEFPFEECSFLQYLENYQERTKNIKKPIDNFKI